MKETRKLKRRHLIYYLRVFEKKGNTLLGHLVDLTVEGFMLVSEAPCKENRQYTLKMMLPEEIDGNNEVSFEAVCVWSKKDVNPDFYGSGFQLMSIPEKVIDVIESMINRLSFKD